MHSQKKMKIKKIYCSFVIRNDSEKKIIEFGLPDNESHTSYDLAQQIQLLVARTTQINRRE